ncbi:MAG: hypothetical protein BWY15_02336 [Firmicutes bacterium ADurb.Bin193]|nr:MAG: hypothetical protein BWY15_02336 [Firmicutes bacterium ADurb.Bin193]
MDKHNFPKGLATLPNWVCWRFETDKNGGDTKVPYCPATGRRASASNPTTWGSLDEALTAKEKYLFHGVEFVFTAESGIIGIDVDHCLNGGVMNSVIMEILSKLPPTLRPVRAGQGFTYFCVASCPRVATTTARRGWRCIHRRSILP